ncbi:hypothetical protein [Microbacterium trichothecenolyticum]|uniref:hypothetical protein n=1 Tax=Microbacterium trichothecenolyticum TaxID=69370 RepID=UPI0027D83657|nr:hypothetical protein [Microbacterium trichothecenolyticum]
MNHSIASESVFPSPIIPEWTVRELLEWIGVDDARCHDDQLTGILDAVNGALETLVAAAAEPRAAVWTLATPTRRDTAPVASVRALALRVSADPAAGERRLGDLVVAPPVPVAESTDRGILLAV